MRLLGLFWSAVRAWWEEFIFLLALNFIWVLAQLTVVLGPPTTAALYVIGQRVIDHELVGFGDLWQVWREYFMSAWVWGAAQLVVYGILGYNLMYFAGQEGVIFLSLRYAWTLLLLTWYVINLYYWPLNLAQTDQRFIITLGNAAKMALLNPGFTIAYALLAMFFIAGSILSGILLGTVMGVWLALWGTLVVQDRLVNQV